MESAYKPRIAMVRKSPRPAQPSRKSPHPIAHTSHLPVSPAIPSRSKPHPPVIAQATRISFQSTSTRLRKNPTTVQYALRVRRVLGRIRIGDILEYGWGW